ncbi:MAG TPA: YdbH domain-containing protein [Chlorobaculum sp.]|nr:YdbH domain-containing protein [Chlorobaculum sp.]
MKWTLRILSILLLSIFSAAAGAWLSFPWYAQSLLDRAAGQQIKLILRDPGRPGPGGMRFGRLDAVLTTKPDTCTGIASTYRVAIYNGTLSWNNLRRSGSSLAGIELVADSLTVLQEPAGILFRDRKPLLKAQMEIGLNSGLFPDFRPESLDYAIDDAVVQTGTLRLEGVSYKARLTNKEKWIQRPSGFRAEKLLSAGDKTPLTGFEATFGMARDPGKPCALIFTDCSVALFGIKATTPVIEYCLKNRRTSFTLNIDTMSLERLPELTGKQNSNPEFTGNLRGSLPIEYLDSTISVNNGNISSEAGTRVIFRKSNGKPMLSFDAGQARGGPAMISNLKAVVTLTAGGGRQAPSVALKGFSCRVFGGSVTASPVSGTVSGKNSFSVRLTELPVLDRVHLHDDFRASLKGSISGEIPVSIDQKGISINNARLSSKGGGTIRQSVPVAKQQPETPFRSATEEVSWNISEPSILLDRDSGGKTRIGFTLRSLSRKAGDGEIVLTKPKGTIGMLENRTRPSSISLSGFSAGLLSGSIDIGHIEYDLKSGHAETVLILNGIPLQKLLDLQGVDKIHATGTLRGRIPVIMDGASFRIPDGGMDTEQSGRIIYTSTPQERALANPGMKITYEALENFFYSELVSSITMSPDGTSHIALQIRGHNPDFQNGRLVNLNLNIEQNLLDLMRSLSIASGIEQKIFEKASRSGNKK